MTESKILFEVYKQYLISTAVKESRPFRIPTGLASLEKRADKSFFYVLAKKLWENKVSTRKQIETFFETASNKLVHFHISNIVEEYDDIECIYKSVKEDTIEDKKNKIKVAFDFLKEYCIINSINNYEDLQKGSPPTILKIWKQGGIDDRILMFMLDLDKVKKKTWYRIYCSKLISKLKKIRFELDSNDNLVSFIESELVKFKNNF